MIKCQLHEDRIERMESTLYRIEEKIDKISEGDTAVKAEVAGLKSRVAVSFWLVGIIVTGVVGGAIAAFYRIAQAS